MQEVTTLHEILVGIFLFLYFNVLMPLASPFMWLFGRILDLFA